ncbi:MAG: DoxX family protein [Acidiferrobacteraceae bacterium]
MPHNNNSLPVFDLLGRVLLAAIFVFAGIGKIMHYHMTQSYMAQYGVPGVLLPAVIAVELGGGLCIILGIFTRIAATALALFSIAAIAIFHRTFATEMDQIVTLAELGFTGGLILLAVNGPGRFSICAGRCAHKKG